MAEFIYTMRAVRKAHGDKVILDDVTLSFCPARRSASSDPTVPVSRPCSGSWRAGKANNGEAFLATGATVGLLARSPRWTRTRRFAATSRRAWRHQAVKLDRFNEIAETLATDYSDELMEEMGRLQEQLDHADAWDLDWQIEQAMDALRCPPPDSR